MSDKYAKFEDYAGDADLVLLDSVWIEEQAKVCTMCDKCTGTGEVNSTCSGAWEKLTKKCKGCDGEGRKVEGRFLSGQLMEKAVSKVSASLR